MFTNRHRIIVTPERDTLVLHGVRDLNTLQEFFPEQFAEKYNWVCAKRYELHSIEEVLTASKALKFNQSEGFVVVDKDFNRIKIKAEQYVAVSHLSMRDNQKKNVSSLLNVIKQNEGDEFLVYFPVWKDLYLLLKQKYNEFIDEVHKTYEKLKKKQLALKLDPKELKKETLEYPYSKCLDALLFQKTESAWDFFAQESDKALEALLNLQNIYLEGQNRLRKTDKAFTIKEPDNTDDFAEQLEKEMKYQKAREKEVELKKREHMKTHQDTAWNKKHNLVNSLMQSDANKKGNSKQEEAQLKVMEKGKTKQNSKLIKSPSEINARKDDFGWVVVQNRKGRKPKN
eukprot:TRINITY_DN4007_c0_g3_i1.p1 TRINITY_DN4007_c0_g3~~TRINITY_DN4007_c0_g3_i1.p1  ORF type:complete len:342 (-),score=83.59 TRINITY_DN4007_c0_g3_i1:20-1045(-)